MQGMETEAPIEERPLRELMAQLARDGSLLVKQEIALAKVELGEKVEKLKASAAAIATGGLVLYAGVLTLIAAAVLLLAEVVAAWLAALLVGAVVTLVGGVLVARGKKNLEKLNALPEKSMASVQRDVEMIKEAVR